MQYEILQDGHELFDTIYTDKVEYIVLVEIDEAEMFEKKMTEEEKKILQKEAKKAKKAEKKKDSKWATKGAKIAKVVVLPLLLASIMVCFLYIVVRNNTLAENLKKDVVVARKDIVENTKISAEEIHKYFEVVRVDADAVVSVYAGSLGELPRDGFYVKEDLVKGQMLHKEDIEESDFVMDKYKEDAVITSLKVSEFSNSVCGSLRYGDIVDVYAVDPATDELVFVVGNVYILGAYNSSGEKLNTAEGSAVAFTVLATPEEVVELNRAIAWEGIQLYLK